MTIFLGGEGCLSLIGTEPTLVHMYGGAIYWLASRVTHCLIYVFTWELRTFKVYGGSIVIINNFYAITYTIFFRGAFFGGLFLWGGLLRGLISRGIFSRGLIPGGFFETGGLCQGAFLGGLCWGAHFLRAFCWAVYFRGAFCQGAYFRVAFDGGLIAEGFFPGTTLYMLLIYAQK